MVFFFKAHYVKGQVDTKVENNDPSWENQKKWLKGGKIVDYKWVDKKGVEESFEPKYFEVVKDLLN